MSENFTLQLYLGADTGDSLHKCDKKIILQKTGNESKEHSKYIPVFPMFPK